MNPSEWIEIGDLPRLHGTGEGAFSRLYSDYVTDFKKVQQFYEADYRSFDNLRPRAIPHRGQLVEVLLEQNTSFGATPKTLDNIRLLGEERTFAVVTGQQVGLLGGPLYTVYKTVTALKLAEQLGSQFPEFRFVPVFWLEGEDHDFEEVSRVGVLNYENVPTFIEYIPEGRKAGSSVGEISLNGALTKFYEDLQKILGNSEFKQPVIDLMKSSYRPDATFNAAFASLMGTLFQDDGLVFISSSDPRLKRIVSPIFEREIREYPRVSQLIIEQSAKLEGNYHAQIKTKALNLFYFHKGGRYVVEPRENDFSLKGTRHFIPKDEMLRIASEQPELLSPNVALRPICQDMLLPTVAYVAGPAEIAYYAQLRNVYKHFDLSMPRIYPRATATIVEERLERILEKYEMDALGFLRAPDQADRKVIDMVSGIKIDEMFDSAISRLNDQCNELKFGINYIDSTLLGALETTRSKMEGNMQALKEKVTAAQSRKHEAALRQIQKVSNTLYPNKNFQERELNAIHFMNKHGLEFVRWLRTEIQIGRFKHQVIRV